MEQADSVCLAATGARPGFMKAAVCEQYGRPEVLSIKEVEKPKPKSDEILIRVHAATVSSADSRIRGQRVPRGFGLLMRLIFGVRRPRHAILGSELAGVVEAVGNEVSQFRVGDAVFAFSDWNLGAHAEYLCMSANGKVSLKPTNITFEQAAALSFGGTTALDFLRKAKLLPGESVLIIGASGAVGSAAIQLAKQFGAHITGVCSTANVGTVSQSGAHHVIDYSQEDFSKNGQVYDVILDAVGIEPVSRCTASLAAGGRLLMLVAGLPQMLRVPWMAFTSHRRFFAGPAVARKEDLRLLASLAQAGTFKPIIGSRYGLYDIVEAHRHVDSGRKRGNVIVTMPTENLTSPPIP